MAVENGLEIPERRIYPVGLHRDAKLAVLAMIPDAQKEEARSLLRTGEEVAVIFAKVSRLAQPFDEIAKGVDEEGSGDFHQKWTVSTEGYGHGSVSEHSFIQIAVENVASLDGDEITDNRPGSYTEFSARFKGRQSMNYFTPASVLANPDLASKWHEVHARLFAACDVLTINGREWINSPEALENFPQLSLGYYADEGGKEETPGMWRARLGKHAADQFKNMLPASRLTSMGVSWNAREAEQALTKLLSSSSPSVREVGEEMKAAALQVSPVLVKYARYNAYRGSLDVRRDLLIDKLDLVNKGKISRNTDIQVKQATNVVSSRNIESLVLAAFLYESSKTGSFDYLVSRMESLEKGSRENLLSLIAAGAGKFDKLHRAWEMDSMEVYENRTMTYGDWRDYKRHRMQTYIAKPLDIKWGYEVSPLARILDDSEDSKYHGSVDKFREAIEEMEELFSEVDKVDPVAARYAVTRSHYRPAIAHFNPREAAHLLVLRTENTAHPSVRQLVWRHFDAFQRRHPGLAEVIRANITGERTKIAFP